MTRIKPPRLYLVPPTKSAMHTRAVAPTCPSHLDEQSLEVRVLLAILRLSNHDGPRPAITQHVLDTLGQVLDSSPQRLITIDAIDTINKTVFARTQRQLEIHSVPSFEVAPDEALFIDSISYLANGQYARHELPLANVMSQQSLAQFREAAEYIVSNASMRGLRRGALHGVSSLAVGSVLECKDLRLNESIVLALMRLWVRGIHGGFDSTAAARLLSTHLGLAPLGDTVSELLHRVASSACRLVDVRCICCPEVSPDEAHMLVLISALGHGKLLEYRDHLLEWLEPQWANAVYMQTADAVLAVGELGSMLPRRKWDFELLRARQPLFGLTGHVAHPVRH